MYINVNKNEMSSAFQFSLQNAFGHNTTSLLQGISQFARIIKTNSTKANPITKTVARLNELKIDAFLSGKNPELSDVSKPVEKTNGQHNDRAQAEKMKKESEHAIAKQKEEKNKILKDLQKINDENEANKKIIEECKDIMTKLREENDQLLKDKEDLKNKITKLERDSVQIAPGSYNCLLKQHVITNQKIILNI
jgi:chromosome segregation ATPase